MLLIVNPGSNTLCNGNWVDHLSAAGQTNPILAQKRLTTAVAGVIFIDVARLRRVLLHNAAADCIAPNPFGRFDPRTSIRDGFPNRSGHGAVNLIGPIVV